MKFHVFMAMSREWTIPFWLEQLEPLDVIWDVLSEKPLPLPEKDWIKPFLYDRGDSICVNHHGFNEWLKNQTVVDEDYYVMLADDDFFEPGFLDKLRAVTTPFIVVSCKRGDNAVGKYSNSTLWASPDNMRRSSITGSQLITRGDIFKKHRFGEAHWQEDGVYIENRWREYPHDLFTFLPEVFQLFNYLEPGRYNDAPKLPQ